MRVVIMSRPFSKSQHPARKFGASQHKIRLGFCFEGLTEAEAQGQSQISDKDDGHGF